MSILSIEIHRKKSEKRSRFLPGLSSSNRNKGDITAVNQEMIQQNIDPNPINGIEPMQLIAPPPSVLSCVRLRSGQVKLFNLQVKLNQWQNADAIPQRRLKQHVVCLHHFFRPMKLDRNLDGRTRRETTPKATLLSYPPMRRPGFAPRWMTRTGSCRSVCSFSSPAIWSS
jgi:hypothetical protein